MKHFSLHALLIFFAWLPLVASAQSYDWQIDSFHSDIFVNEDGSIDVKETIETNFPSSKHGIYRDIPVKYRNTYNQHISLGLEVVNVWDERGQSVMYEVLREGAYRRIKIGDPDVYVSGEKTYVIEYRAVRGLRYLAEHDELYWNVTGNNWEVPITSSSAAVHLPFSTTELLDTICFTGPTGSTAQDCVSETGGDRVVFRADDFMTVAVSWPKGLVSKPSVTKKAGWFISDNWGFLIPLFAAMGAYYVWSRRGRDPEGRGIVRQYEAPDKLSPAETGFLVSQSFKPSFVAAEIIALAELGYIAIKEVAFDEGRVARLLKGLDGAQKPSEKPVRDALFGNQEESMAALTTMGSAITKKMVSKMALKGSIEYELQRKNGTALLKPHQRTLLDSLFADAIDNRIFIADLPNDFYKEVAKVKAAVWTEIEKAGYFSGKPESAIGLWIALAIVAGMGLFFLAALFDMRLDVLLGGILAEIILIVTATLMPKRTVKGVAAYEYSLGFKQYIDAAETERVKWQEKQNIFFEVLPYAMIFGIADKWAKAFEGILTQPPEWYAGASVSSFSPVHFSQSINSFSTAALSHSSPPSSSSSGFSGGSSGGGGGGGGGGSW